MKPISRNFGFWTLMVLGFGLSLHDNAEAAATCLVGAILFDAIKTKSQ